MGATRNLPFEFAARWPQLADKFEPALPQELIELLDRRDRELEDYLAGAERPIKTFNENGAIIVSSSDEYALPYSPRSRIWSGHITTFDTGPVEVTLNLRRGGVDSVIATLEITSDDLFVVPAQHQWLYGDIMWAETTVAGSGNEGFVGEVI